jgi:hypothetical protein
MRRLCSWFCVPVAAALLGAGCGSESSTLGHAEFVERANTQCRNAKKALGKLREPKTLGQFERTVNRSAFVVQRLYDKLTALDAPERDAGRYEQFLKLLDGDIKAVHAVVRAVLNQRLVRLAGLQSARLPAAEREVRLANGLGIRACAGAAIIKVPKPPPSPPRDDENLARVPQGPGSSGPLGKSTKADFLVGCTVRLPRDACECLYDQLTNRYGIDTGEEILELAEQTRRALLSGDPRDLPESLKGAAQACQSKLGFGAA